MRWAASPAGSFLGKAAGGAKYTEIGFVFIRTYLLFINKYIQTEFKVDIEDDSSDHDNKNKGQKDDIPGEAVPIRDPYNKYFAPKYMYTT